MRSTYSPCSVTLAGRLASSMAKECVIQYSIQGLEASKEEKAWGRLLRPRWRYSICCSRFSTSSCPLSMCLAKIFEIFRSRVLCSTDELVSNASKFMLKYSAIFQALQLLLVCWNCNPPFLGTSPTSSSPPTKKLNTSRRACTPPNLSFHNLRDPFQQLGHWSYNSCSSCL